MLARGVVLAANAIEPPKLLREIRFGSLMEQLPNPNNRITPAWDHLDAIGLPRPRIAFTVGTYVRDGMAAAKVLHERLFTELRPPNGTIQTSRSEPVIDRNDGDGCQSGSIRRGRR